MAKSGSKNHERVNQIFIGIHPIKVEYLLHSFSIIVIFMKLNFSLLFLK